MNRNRLLPNTSLQKAAEFRRVDPLFKEGFEAADVTIENLAYRRHGIAKLISAATVPSRV
jgi:hypothetical protein